MSNNPYAPPDHGTTDAATTGATTDGQGTFSVEYELQIDDLVDFQMHQFKTVKHLRRQLILWSLLPTVMLTAFALTMIVDLRDGRTPWLAVAFGVLGVVLFSARSRRQRRAVEIRLRRTLAEGKNRDLFGWRRATIDRTGFREVAPCSELFIRWPGVERVETSERHVLVYTTVVTCALIPKLAFRDQAQLDAFVEAAQRYHREAEQSAG